MLQNFNTSIKSQSLAFLALLAFGFFIFFQLNMLLDVFLGAIIFYVLGKPLVEFFNRKFGNRKSLSAILVILISFIIVLVPLYFFSKMFYLKLASFIDKESLSSYLEIINSKVKLYTGQELITEKNIAQIQNSIATWATSFLTESFSAIGNLGVMYFILYYLLANTGNIEGLLNTYLPFDAQNLSLLGKELENQVFSNALGAPVLATLQGVVASIGFYFFNLPEPIFWGMVAGLFSIIPFVGSALIWFPAAIIQILNNNIWQGVAILIFGILIISTIDNVFRFIFQKKIADVHPLITILGFIFGVKVFGVSGLIFGPLTLSYFLILLKIYRHKFVSHSSVE